MSDAKTVAHDAIMRCMKTEVGQKIVASKLISLTEENRRLKNKINDGRIAVFSLNEIAKILTRAIDNAYIVLEKNAIPLDAKSKSLHRELNNYMVENYSEDMMLRVERILKDTEGDQILLEQLIGKEAKNG